MLPETAATTTDDVARLQRKLERERKIRLQAEAISEGGLRQLYDRNKQLELLEKIATAANQASCAEDALKLTMADVCSFSGWDVGHVYRVEIEDGAPRLHSTGLWHGADGPAFAGFREATQVQDFAQGMGLPGRVVASGNAAWIGDIAADGNFPRERAAQECQLRAASAFPVLSGRNVVAVVEFFAASPREPDEALLRAMSHVGLQLGRALERETNAASLKRRAEELTQARDQANSANRAKSEFLANMSHELRTPLNAIIGFSEMMLTEIFGAHASPTYKEYSKHIHDSGKHLLSIINDILDLSKIEAGKAQLDKEENVALPALFAEVRDTIRLQAEEKHIVFETDAANAPQLLGSARMLRQILTNLLSNAIKFTPDGGKVSVSSALLTTGELRLSITDTGIGMTEADVAIALKPFSQVDGALNRRHEGTGLGLPLAAAMAKLHGAKFRIKSAPSAGTTVELDFPAERVVTPSDLAACA